MMTLRAILQTPEGPVVLATAAGVLLSASMTFSPFLLSVGMWALVASALWQAERDSRSGVEKSTNRRVLETLAYSWRRWVSQPAYLVFSLLFVVTLLSGVWSDDHRYWLERTRVRIPFVVLPWAFANLPRLSWRHWCLVPVTLVAVLVLLCVGVGVNFLLDPDTILFALGQGQPVPVPRQHIRFNLMIVTSVLAGGWLWSKGFYWYHIRERRWVPVAVVFLFVAVHFLSVRSALVALYAALMFTVVRYLHRTRQWRLGLFALGFMAAVPLIAVSTIPSLQQRIGYMRHDWQEYQSSDGGEHYSDSERFVSLHVGVAIWREHPWLGVGIGDLPEATAATTARLYPHYAETPKLPHNQFIYILAGSGMLGLLLSLVAFVYPLTIDRYRRFYLFAVFQVVVFVSFLVEYTLETSIGAAFFLFYQLWWMKMAEADEREAPY